MLDALMKLASIGLPGIVQPARPRAEPASFTIKIPANHPKADQLVRLFKFLETHVVMPSGIEINRQAPVSDPVGEFVGMLRDVVDDRESFDQALAQVTGANEEDEFAALGLSLRKPQVLATLVEASLAGGYLGDRVEHRDDKKWALNMAKKLRGRS